MANHQKSEWNRKGTQIFQSVDILSADVDDDAAVDMYDILTDGAEAYGFAHYYLDDCKNKETEPNNNIYNQLVIIDTELGTTLSEQLFACLITLPAFVKVIFH